MNDTRETYQNLWYLLKSAKIQATEVQAKAFGEQTVFETHFWTRRDGLGKIIQTNPIRHGSVISIGSLGQFETFEHFRSTSKIYKDLAHVSKASVPKSKNRRINFRSSQKLQSARIPVGQKQLREGNLAVIKSRKSSVQNS